MEEFFEEAPIPEDKPTVQETVKNESPIAIEPSEGDEGAWQEFMALKDIADTVREKNRGLGALLANYCRAVYNKKQIVILCDNDRDLTELKTPQSISKISEALTRNRRMGYEIKVAKGNVNDYVKNNSTYENIENNGYFDFN